MRLLWSCVQFSPKLQFRYAKKKRKFMLCVPKIQIALVPIQRKIKFNVGPCGTYESELDFAPKHFNHCSQFPRVWDCSTFNFSLMLLFGFSVFVFFFGFLHHCHCKTTPLQEDIITLTSGVTYHYLVLHPVSSRASRTSGLRVQFIHHSWLIDYRNIWLDFSQRRYFGLFKGMHLLCTLISTHLLYFLVG